MAPAPERPVGMAVDGNMDGANMVIASITKRAPPPSMSRNPDFGPKNFFAAKPRAATDTASTPRYAHFDVPIEVPATKLLNT